MDTNKLHRHILGPYTVPFVNARFLCIDAIHELFNFDETCRRQMQQLYHEYDETKETIVISMYIIDETKTNV